MSLPKIKHQLLTFNIASLAQEIPIDIESDKLYNTITGINIVITDDNAKFSKIQLDINNTEVFPENFEVLRLKFREQAPMGYDYEPIKEPAGGSRIKGTYNDRAGATYPYTVTISFRLENL